MVVMTNELIVLTIYYDEGGGWYHVCMLSHTRNIIKVWLWEIIMLRVKNGGDVGKFASLSLTTRLLDCCTIRN